MTGLDPLARRLIWPLRIAFLVLLVALAVVVVRGGALTERTAEAKARDEAYTQLTVVSRDALLARLYEGFDPRGGDAMLARAARIDEALGAAAAVASGSERGTIAALAEIADALRVLTDSLPPEGVVETYVSGEGRVLAERFIALSDELKRGAQSELSGYVADRTSLRGAVVPLFLLMVAVIAALAAVTLRLGITSAREAESARLVQRIEAERDRADLLAREMTHRVKNLFAVIAAIVTASAREGGAAGEVADRTRTRIEALSRAHDLSSGAGGLMAFSALGAIEAVVRPYAPAPDRLEVGGDVGAVPATAATPLGLIANELATNAVKHGAWSAGEGTVRITVAERADVTEVVWRESGGVPPSEVGGEGFGSAMIEMSVRQLGGGIDRRIRDDGIDVILTIPVEGTPDAPAGG